MIIDCHGHYTTEPKDLHRFRKEQTAAATSAEKTAMPSRASLKMSDDEIAKALSKISSDAARARHRPDHLLARASGMGHHIGDESVSLEWSQILQRSDRAGRVAVPENFIGVCQCRSRRARILRTPPPS